MVSFTDYYNAICLGRLPSKTKFGKGYWYFNNSLLCKPEFSSTTRNLLFFIKNTKKAHSSSYWREYANSRFKENPRTFSKCSTTQENTRISRLKKDYETFTKKKI